MKQSEYLEEVRNQYEKLPYPVCDPQDEKRRLYATHAEHLDVLNHYCFSGKKNFSTGFRALVAGGGTGNAAITLAEQLRDTDAEIVYLDISEASMAIARERANIRGLTNITWRLNSILDIPRLSLGKFDYINCMGVLHHLADPDEGLTALSSVLNPDGAMGLMVYAKYGRTAIYQIQELLRFINHDEQSMDAKIQTCKSVLRSLPKTHWYNFCAGTFEFEINSGDAGLYDLFLHSQDRAYSVPELYDFVERVGLEISHFLPSGLSEGNRLYDPASYVADNLLLAKIRHLDARDQHAIAELLHGRMLMHTFYVSPKRPLVRRIDDLDLVPFLSINFPKDAYHAFRHIVRKAVSTVTMGPPDPKRQITFSKTSHAEQLVRFLDGRVSTRTLFENVISSCGREGAPTYDQLLREMRTIYDAMSIHDWMLLRDQTVKPFPLIENLQARVTNMYSQKPT